MQLQQKLVNRKLKEYGEIVALMKSAFPADERIPIWRLNLLSRKKDIQFAAFYAEGKFCGTTYTIETDCMMFLLYFAVSENFRSRGYGSRIISQLKEDAPQKEIILNVEKPDVATDNYHQRVRRIAFYERNHFFLCNFVLSIAGIDYNVLSTKKNPNIIEFQNIISKCHIGKLKRDSFNNS